MLNDPLTVEQVVARLAARTHAAYPGTGRSHMVDRHHPELPPVDVTDQLREAKRRGLVTCNGLVWIPTPPAVAVDPERGGPTNA